MKQSAIDRNKWFVFVLVAIGVFMATLDCSIVNIALPAIMKDLQVPIVTIGWVLMIYLLTVSSLLLAFGRLSDIKGRRWVFCRGFAIFSLGSLLCAVARSALWLIMARSFQGVGAAMVMACSSALVVDTFPATERGRAMGMVGTMVAAGLTAGPALGGLILDIFSWRLIFYINIPIGIVTAVLADRILKGGNADIVRKESFDWTGAVLLTVCFCSVIIAMSRASTWGYISWRAFFFVAVSISSAIWLIRVEAHTPYPIFEPALLKIRLFTYPVIAAVHLYASLFAMVFLMPFYLIHPSGFSIDQVGYIMVIPFVFLFIVAPLAGAVSDWIGSRLLCVSGLLVMTASLFSLARIAPSASYISVAWRLALAGTGMALFVSPNSVAVLSAAPLNRRGIASGTVATARNMGMVLGVALAGLIFNGIFQSLNGGIGFEVYHPDLEPVFMAAFRRAMQAGAVVAGIGAVVAFLRGPEGKKRFFRRR